MAKTGLFGAAGAIGQSVAAALRERDEAYRVVGRSGPALAKAFGNDPLAEIVTWNPADPASVRAAATGLDTIVYLVGVPYDRFAQHPVLMRATLDGARAAGVERIVLIGTVYPYGRPRAATVAENHSREPHTFKGKMRKAQEDLVLEAHAAGRIRGTVLRLPDFYGDVEKSFLYTAFRAALAGKAAQLVGPIDTPHPVRLHPRRRTGRQGTARRAGGLRPDLAFRRIRNDHATRIRAPHLRSRRRAAQNADLRENGVADARARQSAHARTRRDALLANDTGHYERRRAARARTGPARDTV